MNEKYFEEWKKAKGNYKIERDEHGFAQAISRDGQWIIHLVPGAEFNEQNVDSVIAELNRKVVAPTIAELPKRFVKYLCEIAIDGDWEYGDGTGMSRHAKTFLLKLGIRPKDYVS